MAAEIVRLCHALAYLKLAPNAARVTGGRPKRVCAGSTNLLLRTCDLELDPYDSPQVIAFQTKLWRMRRGIRTRGTDKRHNGFEF